MIKVIIFDFGGVVRKPEMMPHIYLATEKKFGVDCEFVRSQYHKLEDRLLVGKLPMEDFWAKMGKLLGIKDVKGLERVWERTYDRKIKINKKVTRLITRLKKRYQVVLLSDAIPSHANFNKKHGYYRIFDEVFLSNEVGIRKPDRRIYLHAVKKLGVRPDECVFIDDKQENIDAATSLGMKSILFKDYETMEHQLLEYL